MDPKFTHFLWRHTFLSAFLRTTKLYSWKIHLYERLISSCIQTTDKPRQYIFLLGTMIKISLFFSNQRIAGFSGNPGNAFCNPWPTVLHGVLLPLGRGRPQSLIKFDNRDSKLNFHLKGDGLARSRQQRGKFRSLLHHVDPGEANLYHTTHPCLASSGRRSERCWGWRRGPRRPPASR